MRSFLCSFSILSDENFENVTFYFAIKRNLNFDLLYLTKFHMLHDICYVLFYKIFPNPEKQALLNQSLNKYIRQMLHLANDFLANE